MNAFPHENHEDDPLRPFQKKILRLVLQGKNVIIQAPTGAGKTRGALAPYLQNLAHGGTALPRACIYATPMRVLSTQFYEKYREIIAQLDKQRGTDFERLYQRLDRQLVALQTGDQPDDPQFEALLTFCTIDQLLASFLSIPCGIGRRYSNLNTGAIIGSYLVFDEFHLFPIGEEDGSCYGARTTTIAMLQALSKITPFVLMTATFSSELLGQLETLLGAVVVKIDTPEELDLLTAGRRRAFEISRSPMSVDRILERHEGCSLVVCNTVGRAQDLYWRLRPVAQERGIEVILLHSRLTVEDRRVRSLDIIRELGQAPETWIDEKRYGWKDGVYSGRELIVVATQVVEVGLDISVRTLHTEIAPASSLVQRAGRCARFALQEGTVIVYDLPPTPGGRPPSHLPYDDGLCDATFRVLDQQIKQWRSEGIGTVGFPQEQALIDAVHTQEDQDLLARYRQQQDYIVSRIVQSLRDQDRSVTTELIRDVAQVQILIHDHPETIETMPWKYQSFAMHPVSLASRMALLKERQEALGLSWLCKQAIAVSEEENAQGNEIDSRQPTRFAWVDVFTLGERLSMEELTKRLRSTLMIVLPSQLATYHQELGFVLLDGSLDISSTGYQSTLLPEARKKRPSDTYAIQSQNYQEHIGGLVNAYNGGIRQDLAYTCQHLENLLYFPPGLIDQAIRLALTCHDLGKLSDRWQRWALEWQQTLYQHQGWRIYERPQDAYWFAKTDFDGSRQQRTWQAEMPTKRPRHACEGVAVGMNLIADSLSRTAPGSEYLTLLITATLGAIARHHAPGASTYETVQLQPGIQDTVRDALELARQNLPWSYDLGLLTMTPITGDDLAPSNEYPLITIPKEGRKNELETWLYFVIARALRLADQRADRFREAL